MAFLYTVTEVSRMLRVDVATVRRWIKDNILRDVIGLPCRGKPDAKIWRIPSTSLASLLDIEEARLPEVPVVKEKISVGVKKQAIKKAAKAHGENVLQSGN